MFAHFFHKIFTGVKGPGICHSNVLIYQHAYCPVSLFVRKVTVPIVHFGMGIMGSDWRRPVLAGERWNHLHYVSSPHVLRSWKVCAMHAWRMRPLLTPIKADGREETEIIAGAGITDAWVFTAATFVRWRDWITDGLVDRFLARHPLVVFGITYYHSTHAIFVVCIHQ